jgi:hypothetical protein
MTAANNGGRVSFDKSLQYRVLLVDGTVSTEMYTIESERSDRKGLVILREVGTDKTLKAQHRRVIPASHGDKCAVIESGGKYRSICQKCNYIETIETKTDKLSCPIHGQFDLYWLGVKPMAQETAINPDKKERKPTPDKKVKPAMAARDRVTIDITTIASTPQCELYVKNVNFDHEKFDVKSYVLLFVATTPRKFCFNTYNGELGKKASSLPISEFISNTLPPNSKSKPWYAVQDLEKMREKLAREGYVRV